MQCWNSLLSKSNRKFSIDLLIKGTLYTDMKGTGGKITVIMSATFDVGQFQKVSSKEWEER